MGQVVPLPRLGDVFDDVRGGDRTMRMSWHRETGIAVISLWADGHCRASCQLSADDTVRLATVLREVTGTAEAAGTAEVTGTAEVAGAAEETGAATQDADPAAAALRDETPSVPGEADDGEPTTRAV